jgi:hypothetical protein
MGRKFELSMPSMSLTVPPIVAALYVLKCRREMLDLHNPHAEAAMLMAAALEERLRERWPENRIEQLLEHAEAWEENPNAIPPNNRDCPLP